MPRLLRMEHPDIKDKTAPTTMAAFKRTWEGKGWKLVDEEKARKAVETERAEEQKEAEKAAEKASSKK